MNEPDPAGDDQTKLTRVGCVLTALSVVVMFAVAVPIVQWRDPETGKPLPRTLAILAPLLIGAAFHGIASFVLRLVGLPVWSQAVEADARAPDE